MLVEVKNLKKYYKTNEILSRKKMTLIKVLDGVNFYIRYGERVGLIGKSGCGKSTLARQLVKLEKPTNGNILFQGQDIWQGDKKFNKKFRQSCQLIFQNTMASLNPLLKIKDILLEPIPHVKKFKKLEEVIRMLQKVNIHESVLDKKPYMLSGGQCQKINICRALMVEPKLLICDEITSNVDILSKKLILDLLDDIACEFGVTMLFISHDINSVKQFCSRIISIDNGKNIQLE